MRLGLLISLFIGASHASENPLRDPSRLASPVIREQADRVLTARVVWANYELLRRDFASLRSLSQSQIDSWLERHAVISRAQAKQIEFNSKPNTEDFDGVVLRPKDYNRSLVVDTGEGLLDIKGAGSNRPRSQWEDGDPRDGTFTLGAGIREVLFGEVIKLILDFSELRIDGERVDVVENYALLSGGFDVIHRDFSRDSLRIETGRSPWGFLFRQGSTRFSDPMAQQLSDQGKYSLWNERRSLLVERLLRRFGITSIGSGRNPVSGEGGINIQGSKENTLMDFGHMVVLERFNEQAVPHFYGQRPLLVPGGDFPQPILALSLPVETWGSYHVDQVDSQLDRPWVYSAQTAAYIDEKVRSGDLASARLAMDQHLRTMIQPFEEKLQKARSCSWVAQGL